MLLVSDMTNDVAILVVSCDKYQDLWKSFYEDWLSPDGFFANFYRHFNVSDKMATFYTFNPD